LANSNALNPYNRLMVPGSILKLEQENLDSASKARRQLYCYAISAKRYSLFNKRPEDLRTRLARLVHSFRAARAICHMLNHPHRGHD
jgi:hypothetical protein